MVVASQDIKVVCEIGGDDETVFISIKLMDGLEQVSILEFADITNQIDALIDINQSLKLYDNIKELKVDIAAGYLAAFLNKKNENPRLTMLNNVKMRIDHQSGLCESKCIYCNPDLGEDSFPDFTAEIKNAETKGQA